MSQDKKYEINIDPRILELLGPSLYTNIYYILAELIANAYDANAENVYIIQEDDCIVVEDDGNGMSYADGDIRKYLNVAQETRIDSEDTFVNGSKSKRQKMGRKGVGKLAALSVSENVEIHTTRHGERSGFVLSRNVKDDRQLDSIPDDQVTFRKIGGDGTSVVMKSPQYELHKGLDVIAKNLLKIFPLVDAEFRIHVFRGKNSRVIDSFEKELVRDLGGLVILGEEFSYLEKFFDSQLTNAANVRSDLLKIEPAKVIPLTLTDRSGSEQKFELKIVGWIGVYRSSKGRKLSKSDFPDNFLSLLSKKKLGEFNILELVGKNALNEVYVVGQLHVDLFEETSLPDMALSNRQGYKTDDPRYQEVIDYVREKLLPQVIGLRVKFASYLKEQRDADKRKKASEREAQLRKKIDTFKDKASASAVKKISQGLGQMSGVDQAALEASVKQAINTNLPDLGIKKSVDDAKRRILLSHTAADKAACDFIYDLLLHNNVPASHIIYTNADNEDSRIPDTIPGIPIFEYLREFFVDSYSTQKIHVIYVTSEDMSKSWAAVSEVGAGWITQQTHDIVNINKFTPKRPLNVDTEWANIIQEEKAISIDALEADKVAGKIIKICNHLGYTPKSKEQVLSEISRIANLT